MRRPTSKAGETDGEAGYTYIAVMVIVVALAIAAQVTNVPSESARIRDMEAEILFRGDAYRRAIASYWEFGAAAGDPRLPDDLADLLDDPREDGLRHIRRLYEDPTGEGWEILRGAGVGVEGVAPGSRATPRKTAFFPAGYEDFEEAESYRDWTFVFEP